MKGMKESEYKACIDNLGLLEGEEIKCQLVCFRQEVGAPSIWGGQQEMKNRKGLLVFTNDNMIFMQQEGAWSSDYSQALRFSLEDISGVSGNEGFTRRLRILIGGKGNSEYHDFLPFRGYGKVKEIRSSIMKTLQEVREEKKQFAQEALIKGTIPTMIFCKYCGARNKSEKSHCVNCGAILT